jgi:flagellar biosynthesis/type III secretory pathway protein FliH
MNIKKLNLNDLASNKEVVELPIASKNFSYFAKKDNVEEPEFTKSYVAKQVEDSSKNSFEQGYNKGKEEIIKTALQLEQNTENAIKQVALQLTEFLNSFEEYKKNYMREMTKITMLAISKICKNVIKENSEEVIFQALEKSSEVFSKHPEIVFKSKNSVLEKIKDKLEKLTKELNYKGTISYIADESLTDGSCVLEWGKSGTSINSMEVLKQIEETLSEHLKSI